MLPFIYTLPNCVQCNQTKKAFDKAGVNYVTRDLTQDEEAYRWVTETLGYKAAPVIVVVNVITDEIVEHWSGFQPEKIATFKTQSVRDNSEGEN